MKESDDPAEEPLEENASAETEGVDEALSPRDLANLISGFPQLKYPQIFAASSAIARLAGAQAQFSSVAEPLAKFASDQAKARAFGADLAKVIQNAGLVGSASPFARMEITPKLPGLEKLLARLGTQFEPAGAFGEITELKEAALRLAGVSKAIELAVASTRADAFIQELDRQRALLLELAAHIGEVGATAFPPNWETVDASPNFQEILTEEGLALAWVPPPAILQQILDATSAGKRRQIISRNRKQITAACIAELEAIDLGDCESQAWVDDFALEAAYALREGRWRASQALSANLLDSVLTAAIDGSIQQKVRRSGGKKWEQQGWETFSAKDVLVFSALYGVHSQYRPGNGDPVPKTFSRHASVHSVSLEQYKPVNAVIALMHVVGLLRLVEGRTAS